MEKLKQVLLFSLIIRNIVGCRFAVWPSSFPPVHSPLVHMRAHRAVCLHRAALAREGRARPLPLFRHFPPHQHRLPSRAFSISCASFHARPPRTGVSRALFGEALLLRRRDTAPLRAPRSSRANQKRSCSACVK